jgi:tRNA-specific 2-thiouridylase
MGQLNKKLFRCVFRNNRATNAVNLTAMGKGVVVAAMSGGVDSAVTAALLKQEGYEVIGITLQIWQEHSEQGKYGGCCSLGAVEDARRAAAKIGIPHYVLNFRDYFANKVIDRFIEEYRCGRTPNPCVECNRTVKFEELLRQAENLGADFLATGHYARVRFNEQTGRYELLRARDSHKDQSYALYTLRQEALAKTLFPLGHIESKQETRRIARELGLPLANKPDSQEICFVPKEGYIAFLKEKAPTALRPGPIVDTAGRKIGEHPGVAFYTIGQRKRLPAGQKEPLFVVALDAETNTVVVGPESELYATGFLASECNWIALSGPPQEAPLAVQVKIRYNGQAASALIREGDARGTIVGCFTQPQRAVTPGQSAVFYGGEGEEAGQVVLGGGILAGALKQSS